MEKKEAFWEGLGLSQKELEHLEKSLAEKNEKRKEAERREKPITELFPKLVLASESPRRPELIQLLGLRA